MDPLSIASGIITVLQAAGAVVSLCYEIRAGLHKAPWTLTRIIEETRDLRNVLEAVQSAVEHSEAPTCPSHAHKENPNATLDSITATLAACYSELELLGAKIRASGIDRAADSKLKTASCVMRWKLVDRQATECLERLDRCKTSLGIALSSQTMTALRATERATEKTRTALGQIASRVEHLAELSAKNRQSWLGYRRSSPGMVMTPLSDCISMVQLSGCLRQRSSRSGLQATRGFFG
ncbi:hypothetical protein CONLIGDRAFT_53052 [Coniochaeta ligniaria NRRL 30616]|uniref:Fungal N-terminal domain-containing protein n=1 Tax=Coniochaeta ligniaria NRRL 30616 TaxID=1408157 RepID=A0A1J7J7I0_9PEZI|nr:hypothetical protein CONLIGDRAFT_53052 [Coniochaeta ligniaria NRRL 30616]